MLIDLAHYMILESMGGILENNLLMRKWKKNLNTILFDRCK